MFVREDGQVSRTMTTSFLTMIAGMLAACLAFVHGEGVKDYVEADTIAAMSGVLVALIGGINAYLRTVTTKPLR